MYAAEEWLMRVRVCCDSHVAINMLRPPCCCQHVAVNMLLSTCCSQCVGDNNGGSNGVAAHVVRVFVTCHGVAKCAGMVLLGV